VNLEWFFFTREKTMKMKHAILEYVTVQAFLLLLFWNCQLCIDFDYFFASNYKTEENRVQ